MSNTFALLWGKTLDSSVWQESKETRLLWFTILAMKDQDGIVRASVAGLAHRARITVEECRESLRVLTSPDKDDTSGVKNGVRLEVVKGVGWRVVNNDLYKFSTEARREAWRIDKERQRLKTKHRLKKSKPLDGEAEAVKAWADGDDEKFDTLSAP